MFKLRGAPSLHGPFAQAAGQADWNGAVAQLGERVVRNDEVSGSIPLGSTSWFLFGLKRRRSGGLRPSATPAHLAILA